MYIAVCNPLIDTTIIHTFPILQEEDDDKDTVWISNKYSTVKTEKSKITPMDNNCDKDARMEKIFIFTPGHYNSTGCLYNPELYKQIILATSLQQVLASFQQKWKRRFNMPYQIQELLEIFWYKELL